MGRWVWRHYVGRLFDDHHPATGHLTPTTPEEAGRPKRFFSFARKPPSPTIPRSLSPTLVRSNPAIGAAASPAANPTLEDHDDESKNHHHARKWLRQAIGIVYID